VSNQSREERLRQRERFEAWWKTNRFERGTSRNTKNRFETWAWLGWQAAALLESQPEPTAAPRVATCGLCGNFLVGDYCSNCDAHVDEDAQDNAPSAAAPLVTGEISDGYHTFNELYEHRHALFSVVCAAFDGWKSMLHEDGTMFDGWFIAGVNTPKGMATYHLPMSWWDKFAVTTLPKAPHWDGHTAQQVPERIASLAKSVRIRKGLKLDGTVHVPEWGPAAPPAAPLDENCPRCGFPWSEHHGDKHAQGYVCPKPAPPAAPAEVPVSLAKAVADAVIKNHEVWKDDKEQLLAIVHHALVHAAPTAAPLGEPWAYAIETPGGDMYDGEYAVFGDERSCRDQVENLNDDLEETEEQYKVVPLYRAPAPAPPAVPAEVTGKLQTRIETLEGWLLQNAPHVFDEQKHTTEGTVERNYWHYGYLVALRDVVALAAAKGDRKHE